MINMTYADFGWEQAEKLLAIDSPAGFTGKGSTKFFSRQGKAVHVIQKDGVIYIPKEYGIYVAE